jgi:hypothetical protein
MKKKKRSEASVRDGTKVIKKKKDETKKIEFHQDSFDRYIHSNSIGDFY